MGHVFGAVSGCFKLKKEAINDDFQYFNVK